MLNDVAAAARRAGANPNNKFFVKKVRAGD